MLGHAARETLESRGLSSQAQRLILLLPQSLVDGAAIEGRARQARKYLQGFEDTEQRPRRGHPDPSLTSAEPLAVAAKGLRVPLDDRPRRAH